MKSHLIVAAICLSVCTGCQSSNLLSGRLGHGREEPFADMADASGSDNHNPGLPPPTNADQVAATETSSPVNEHLLKGETELRQGHEDAAQAHFEQALLLEPEDAKANHRMAVVCDKLGQYDRAEQHYQIALKHDPRNVAILSDLGYSYWMQSRYADSERYLLQARSIDPNYETAVANLGMLYGTTGRSEEALAMFRQIGDEAQVQEIMSQVTTLAARRGFPPTTDGPMTPAQLTGEFSADPNEGLAGQGETKPLNEPTRELLELMEQGRRQQQLAEQAEESSHAAQQYPASEPRQQAAWPARQTGWPAEQVMQAGGNVPPHVRNRQTPTQQQAGPPANRNGYPHQQPAVRPSGPRQVPTHMLNQALAAIDHQGRTPPSGPVSIGPNASHQQGMMASAQPQRPPATYPQNNNTGSFPQQQPNQPQPRPTQFAAAQPTQSPQPGGQLNPPVTTAPQDWNQSAAQAPMAIASQSNPASASPPVGMPPTSAPPAGQMPAQQPPEPEQFAAAEPAATGDGDGQFNPAVVTSGGIQQASAEAIPSDDDWANPSPSPASQPVEHAHHQQNTGASGQIDLAHASSAGPAESFASRDAPSAKMANSPPDVAATQTKAADPFQQARRQAAIMGLGAGPGQMFPYVQQTHRAVPGTDSRLNGAQYPPPQRQLPTDRKPANLKAAFVDPTPANLSPNKSFDGQPLPQITAPANRPVQYGAASSGSFQQHPQAEGNPADPTGGLQKFQDTRRQQGQQLSGLINQTYGQPPQSPPFNAAAPQSQFVNAPAQQPAGNESWSRPPSARLQTSPPSPDAQWAEQSSTTAPSKIVIPEPYRVGSGSSVQRQNQRSNSTSQSFGSAVDVPAIIPKTR